MKRSLQLPQRRHRRDHSQDAAQHTRPDPKQIRRMPLSEIPVSAPGSNSVPAQRAPVEDKGFVLRDDEGRLGSQSRRAGEQHLQGQSGAVNVATQEPPQKPGRSSSAESTTGVDARPAFCTGQAAQTHVVPFQIYSDEVHRQERQGSQPRRRFDSSRRRSASSVTSSEQNELSAEFPHLDSASPLNHGPDVDHSDETPMRVATVKVGNLNVLDCFRSAASRIHASQATSAAHFQVDRRVTQQHVQNDGGLRESAQDPPLAVLSDASTDGMPAGNGKEEPNVLGAGSHSSLHQDRPLEQGHLMLRNKHLDRGGPPEAHVSVQVLLAGENVESESRHERDTSGVDALEMSPPGPEADVEESSSGDTLLSFTSSEAGLRPSAEPERNIDEAILGDPLYATEYIQDIVQNLRASERRRMPNARYMDDQDDISPRMRAQLVDWLIEVQDEYLLRDETSFITVSYVDRFLTHMPRLHHTRLQLVGIVCMMLASKFEEIHPPNVEDFAHVAAGTYQRDELIRMESLILNTLNFNMVSITPLQYLPRMLRAVDASPDTCVLSLFLCTLSMVDYRMIRYPPSIIAVAAVALARHTHALSPWCPNLSYYSGLTSQDVRRASWDMYQLWVTAYEHPNPGNHIKQKFRAERFRSVSVTEPPLTAPWEGSS
ncbi:G2/mitotic-specific cyclin-A [Porphyridium purpureum]|uniref:G2/mitotic-specific cyclin-A n=1 Tax=Porphyridium purpureum TaxID=35688 RepID=A0A5J4YYC5_PORPP|nr:G2/mitotic-specific cyclin-A [Porphyridium purpureum]|eukprot:POR0114..scf209_3